jgi:hypothetical protein
MGLYERGCAEEGGSGQVAVSGGAALGGTDVSILHRKRSADTGGVMSTSGMTALALKVRRKMKTSSSIQNPDSSPKPKEETWEK